MNKRSGRNLDSDCKLELDSDQNLTAVIQGAVVTADGD